jgi:hypothetical protein
LSYTADWNKKPPSYLPYIYYRGFYLTKNIARERSHFKAILKPVPYCSGRWKIKVKNTSMYDTLTHALALALALAFALALALLYDIVIFLGVNISL